MGNESKSKLWGGRFSEDTERIVEEFNASITFDKRMALFDITGSISHVKMLANQGIILTHEAQAIESGLKQVAEEIRCGEFKFNIEDEDVHMAVEKRLTVLVGDVGGKLHTARSRNDQVALDFRLYLRDGIDKAKKALVLLMQRLCLLAKDNSGLIMPGYTHLQTAQPVLFAHYVLAYFQMFKRDYERLDSGLQRLNYSPLGAGALAGTTFPIDRHMTARELGFYGPTENSLDSVSDRDFALDFLFASSVIFMHLSRFCEELIIFSTSEFAFVELSDGFCTGSSIMPQKKNPDIPELIRGKSGRVYGSLMGLLTVMKGLPLAYNKDMQEDKEGVFDTLDTLLATLAIFEQMLAKMRLNSDNMRKAAEKGYSTATDMADYLVRKGLPFRNAHHVVGQTVQYAISCGKKLQELDLSEFRKFSGSINEDIYDYITVEACIRNRNSYGGTSYEAVNEQLKNALEFLKSVQ